MIRVVILGSGRVGSSLAGEMAKLGHRIILVDQDTSKFKNLDENDRIERLTGNIFDDEVASAAFSKGVDVFIVVTGKDNVNLMAAQAMQQKYKIPRVLVRVFDPVLSDVYEGLGLETICPTKYAIEVMLKKLQSQ